MKTIEEVIDGIHNNMLPSCFDGRDLIRLAPFMTVEQIVSLGYEFNDEESKNEHTVLEFTKENILVRLERDVKFGFEKALDQRGISAGLMFNVVCMWNVILEEGLEDFSDDNYAYYGLPLFKATAIKYGFENPIGDDLGNEFKYEQ